jgi:hypothetical protein
MNVTKTVFLDTNVFLHYQPYDQISWPEILNASNIIIVVPPVIFRELNKHKDSHPRQHIKERASKVIKKFGSLVNMGREVEIKSNIKICFEDREPEQYFTQFQLDRNSQDDHLIVSILMYKNENPSANIVLVTSDLGLLLIGKAKRLNISSIELPNELKLAEEPDADQIRIKHLESKIRELESKMPQLSMSFEDGLHHSTFTLHHPAEIDPDGIAKTLNLIKQQYPKIINRPNKQYTESTNQLAGLLVGLNASLGSTLMPEDIDKYNTELDKYYETYAEYLNKCLLFQNIQRKCILLSLFIKNDGTAPAEDLDIFMHFPDGFKLINEKKFPHTPEPPKPPQKPKTPMEKFQESMNQSLIIPSISALSNYRLPTMPLTQNVSVPKIRRKHSYDVDLHAQRLKHLTRESLDPLCLIFDSFDTAQSFQIDYRILAANLPTETIGKLQVVINKD